MTKAPQQKQVFHIITCLNDGGAEGVLTRLCLHSKGTTHQVISLMDKGKYGPILETAGIKVYCLGMNPGRPSVFKFFKLIKLIRKIRPDVVQTWMYHADLLGGLAAKFAGVNKIFWGIRHSTLEKDKTKRSTILIANACARLSSWLPKKIICCAHKALDAHAELGYKKQKLLVIPNGYDLTQFKPNQQLGCDVREEFGISKDEFLIGKVGRFDPFKDHANLLNALAALPKQSIAFRCILVGKDLTKENSPLVDQIAQLGLTDKIILAGQRSDIPAVMNALDLHVLSSSSEAFPNVLAEAMACGTPCVTTDVGDALEIVGDASVVCRPRDSLALSKLIQNMFIEYSAHNDAWRQRQLDSVKRIEDNYSIQSMVSAYESHWLN